MAMPVSTTSLGHKHVAVFAFPFGSHRLCLRTLLVKLAHAAPMVTFSFFSTSKCNQFLFHEPGNSNNILHNVKLYSVDDGVPQGHVLTGHPLEEVNLFLKASPRNFLKAIPVAVVEAGQELTCLLGDGFLTFSGEVAEGLHVPWIPVWVPLPSSLSAHINTDQIRERFSIITASAVCHGKSKTLDFIPGLSLIHFEDLPDDILIGGEGETLFLKTINLIGKVRPQAKAIVMNFYAEFNPPLLNQYLKSKFGSVLNVGCLTVSLPPLLLPPSESDSTGCLSWLDSQKPKSVAYIGFGTVVAPSQEELRAVAEALQTTGIPFLWSLKYHLRGLLPNGFPAKTRGYGKIVPWAPQTHVLGHDSVGVHVTHCGTNSVFESIANGVPIIFRPFVGDNGMTGRMVEDVWGVGVKVEGGIFSKDGLIKSLNLILVQQEGKKMRDKAHELRKTLFNAAASDGNAAKDFEKLVELINPSS